MVPSGDTRPSSDADAGAGADVDADAGADADASSDSALLLRMVLRARRVYCSFVSSSFSSLLMKGDKVCGCASV